MSAFIHIFVKFDRIHVFSEKPPKNRGVFSEFSNKKQLDWDSSQMKVTHPAILFNMVCMPFINNNFIIRLLINILLVMPVVVIADGISFENFRVVGNAPKYQVLTSTKFELSNYLQNALDNGVPLNAHVQFRLKQKKKYWFDKETILLTVNYQLNYHALSQHYLLTRNDTNEHWNFSNSSAALRKLSELRKYILPAIKIPLDGADYSILAVADMAPATLNLPLRIQSLFNENFRLISEGILWPLP